MRYIERNHSIDLKKVGNYRDYNTQVNTPQNAPQ